MNIGDGLTLQSQTIGGKTTSGIFLLPSKSQKAVTKSVKRPGNYNPKLSNDGTKVTKPKPTQVQVHKRKTENTSSQIPKLSESKSVGNDVVFIDNNTRIEVGEKGSTVAKTNQVSTEKVKLKQKKDSALSQEKKVVPKHNNSGDKLKQVNKSQKVPSHELKVDTNFVTLTQDQLNIILNLVKTKQEIDIATVMDKKGKNSRANTSEKKTSSEGKRIEPNSVPGLDLGSPSQDESESKTESDKENDAQENVSKLLEKVSDSAENETRSSSQGRSSSRPTSKSTSENTSKLENVSKKNFSIAELSGTLGGYGSRDREKSRLEEKRKKWIADLNEQVEHKKKLQQSFTQKSVKKEGLKSSSTDSTPANDSTPKASNVRSALNSAAQKRKADASVRSNSSTQVEEIHGSLPTAIRSSFFLGEAAPREHAYSAKKRQDQQAWREELENQIKEREKLKKQTTRKEPDDTDMWSRHFETMNPVQSNNKPQQTTHHEEIESPPDPIPTPVTQPVTSHQKQSPRNPAFNSDNISGIYSGEHTSNSTGARGARVQSNYLRSMTALLDPSQLDAMELKRQKQLEHRKIIAEQVEEKRRLKEAEMRAKRAEEELEEKRLEEERTQLKNQFEREKTKQQAIEEKRDRQTQELYQQMKDAEASALREKFEKKEQNLRSHGHDTSRLARTHKHALEKNMSTLRLSPPPVEHIPSLNIKDVPSHHEFQESPRGGVLHTSMEQPPLTVMTNSGQVPIKLEISLNHNHGGLVARAVQTDDVTVGKKVNRRNDTLLEILSDSDTETQYMDLPYPSARQNAKNSRKTTQSEREEVARNRHYNRYSRTNKQEDEPGEEREKKGPKPKWGVAKKKKQYVSASNKYSKREKEERENRLRKREEQLLAEQARNQPDRLVQATTRFKTEDKPTLNTVENYRPQRKGRSHSPQGQTSYHAPNANRNRSSSPPVPALQNQMRTERSYNPALSVRSTQQNRPDTAISVTTEQAKYQSSKHSPDSPVPDTDDFVEYRRSDVILDPNQPLTRPNTEKEERHYSGNSPNLVHPQHTSERSKDPLLNADMLKQKDRQDRILKEISILRQGLLLKQREVASYPVAVSTHNSGKNLPERTNDISMT